MGENSKIEWTVHTFNPWIGCQKVSPGCDRCYAEAMMDHRYGRVQWGPHGERKRTSEVNWRKPLQWAKQARAAGNRPRVFCASLADVFDNRAPTEWRDDLWQLIRQTPELDWLLLTKRPQNIGAMLPVDWRDGPYPNIWLGTTAENQEQYGLRFHRHLYDIPAAVRFVSYEPALGPLVIAGEYDRPDWIICGGESGPGARLMDPEWARSLRDQCKHDGIAFFMKQMTGKAPIPDDLLVRQFPAANTLKAADAKNFEQAKQQSPA
jgi:protein gp37